jgi:hypothetical protein
MREHGQNTDNLHNNAANGHGGARLTIGATALILLGLRMVPAVGLEPTTIGLKGHCSTD